jgi:hypothetical protein
MEQLASVPPAPRTPSERARALIFRYQGGQLVFLMLGLAFLLIGGLVGFVANRDLPGDLGLAMSKRDDVGVVTETEINRHVSVNDQHPTIIRFRYRVGAEELIGESSTRDGAIIAAARPGAEVPIEVSPASRTWARIRGTTYSSMGLVGLVFLILPSLGAIIALLAIRSNRRARRAFTIGRAITARVTYSGLDGSVRINGRNPWRIAWELTVDGRVYTGSVSSMRQDLIADLMPAKELVVLYDPENPRINTAYV